MHGIKIKHPWFTLTMFIILDLILVVWLEVFKSSVSIDVAPVFIAFWLLGFISKDFRC